MLATSFTKKEARTKSNTQEPPSKQEEAGSEQLDQGEHENTTSPKTYLDDHVQWMLRRNDVW